jgi:predicted amidohydrolase
MTRPIWRLGWLAAAPMVCLVGILGAAMGARAAWRAASTRPAIVRVAAIQFMSKFGDPTSNRRRLVRFIRAAARKGAKIIVLPETAITGYMTADLKTTWRLDGWPVSNGLKGASPQRVAETVPGPSTQELADLAGRLGIYLTVPLLEVEPQTGRYFNTVVLVGPGGRILLHYRKLNPWPFAERGWAAKGDLGHPYVDTPYGRLGLLICYDINSEPPALQEAGVDTLLYPIAWVDSAGSTWFSKELPDIAARNNMNVIGANWTVPVKPDWHGYGQSLIVDRTGRALARASKDIGEEIIYADLAVPTADQRLLKVAPDAGRH